MKDRILEIMKELKMDTRSETDVINATIIYITAQRDLLKEQLEKI